MKYLIVILCLLLAGCSAQKPDTASRPAQTLPPPETITEETTAAPTEPPDPLQEILEQMSLDERVGQLFLARCDQATALTDIDQYHLGGFVLFGRDFQEQTPDSIRETIASYQSASKLPLLIAVDEEGGTVTRISRYPSFREAPFPSPREIFDWGGMDAVLTVEEEKCQLLSSLDINVNLGPVCDISTHPQAFMYRRSLGQDPQITSEFIARTTQIMNTYQIGSALKHFPGYGNNTDTHTGIAVDSRSLEELEGNDLIPFSAGIEAGCGAVMVSHTIVEALDDTLPASLSPAAHQYLRETMGFTRVILTDDLVMEAITEQFGAGEAAVQAVLAGNDLLCSTDYVTQYQAVLDAVLEGRIDIEILDRAVRHVLGWKQSLGLL